MKVLWRLAYRFHAVIAARSGRMSRTHAALAEKFFQRIKGGAA